MSFEDRVLALFADANPVSHDASLDQLMRPSLQLIEQGEHAMSDEGTRSIDPDRTLVQRARSRGLRYGAAAAMLVMAAIGWMALAGSGEKTLEEAAEGGDALAVLEIFHQRWSEGDVDGALAFVRLDAGTATFVRNIMEYTVAVEPPGWNWSIDCTEQVPGVYSCRQEMVGDPVIDAMGLEAGFPQFRLDGNRITEVGYANYTQADLALAVYAAARDPGGYDAVCTNANGQAFQDNGVVYDRACGTFLSRYVGPLAAELTAP